MMGQQFWERPSEQEGGKEIGGMDVQFLECRAQKPDRGVMGSVES